MTMHFPLLIRVDASKEMGTGHAMRMLALAQAWQGRGGSVQFATIEMPPQLVSRLRAGQVEVISLCEVAGGSIRRGSRRDATHTAALAKQIGAAWVVADGYVFDSTFQTTIQQAELSCAMVTDFDYCDPWNCELILNQNPHAIHEPYSNSVDSCKRLLGTRFALLRQEFLEVQAAPEDRDAVDPRRVLITLGGSDPDNATGRLLALLDQSEHAELAIRVLVGAANPHRLDLEHAAATSRHRVDVMTNVQEMSGQYRWADGIISAGGSTCWEWLYFGLPGAILVIADNQFPIYRELTSAGTATGLGTLEALRRNGSAAGQGLGQLLRTMHCCPRRPTQYRHLVDGYGASRVAAELDTGIWLRQANDNDRQLYFDWANDPEVRQNSLCSEKIEWQSHCQWFDGQLNSADARLLVALREETPVGQIRFNRTPEDEWNVGFSVCGAARGTGVGKELVRLGSAWMDHEALAPLVATVKADNHASALCFSRLGWETMPTESSTRLRYRKAAP
ncbi:MAG: UDP-2,4-diacetamido-2,4,6-trideoxy-beta-L-altropyranose hydrolase [Candidatus Paceibacterota bacterium]